MTKCIVEDCGNTSRRRGMCEGHYTQVRRGQQPHKLQCSRTDAPEGEQVAWLRDNADHSGSECLIWPFSRYHDGRGQVSIGNRTRQAHKVMCELAHGKAPSSRHETAHSCGKGHKGCVHPGHLRWATHAENMADTVAHDTRVWGERHPFHKLTESDVLEIRASYGLVTNEAQARKFGVSAGAIAKVGLRQRWSHI